MHGNMDTILPTGPAHPLMLESRERVSAVVSLLSSENDMVKSAVSSRDAGEGASDSVIMIF